MRSFNLETRLAVSMYEHEGGMTNDDYLATMGEERPAWEMLAQHQQDAWFYQARNVLELLTREGVLKTDR